MLLHLWCTAVALSMSRWRFFRGRGKMRERRCIARSFFFAAEWQSQRRVIRWNKIVGNSLDKLRHTTPDLLLIQLDLLNKHQGGGAYLDCCPLASQAEFGVCRVQAPGTLLRGSVGIIPIKFRGALYPISCSLVHFGRKMVRNAVHNANTAQWERVPPEMTPIYLVHVTIII